MNNLCRLRGITSKYKGVSYRYNNRERVHYWEMSYKVEGLRAHKLFPFTDQGEHDAAKAYDMKRIEFGKKPVNILKKA